jgi:hypothetical protein
MRIRLHFSRINDALQGNRVGQKVLPQSLFGVELVGAQ